MWYMRVGHTPTRWCIMMCQWSMESMAAVHGTVSTLRTSDVSWRRNHLVPCRESSGIWSPSLFCKGADGGGTWGMAIKPRRILQDSIWTYGYMDQYLLIPFLGEWTSILTQLFWCELQGYKVLTHCHIWNMFEVSMSRWMTLKKLHLQDAKMARRSARVLRTARQQLKAIFFYFSERWETDGKPWKPMETHGKPWNKTHLIAIQDLFLPLNTWAVNLVKCSPTHLSTGSTTRF